MDRISDAASTLDVQDLEGRPVPLGSLWKDRPAVVAFLRHFGWMFCREQAVQLHREREAFEEAGADLVFVGNGAPHFARAFAEDFGITSPIYVDVERATYRALGMHRRGLAMLLSPATLAAGVRALRGGFMQGITRGDEFQLGGVLVVRPGGEVTFRHVSGHAGDHPPVPDVLAAAAAR